MRINGKEVSVNQDEVSIDPKESSETQSMEHTEKTIDKSRRTCPLSDTIVQMLVSQMGSELSNHNMYRTFADYFRTKGLSKLESYYIDRANEENNHHNWIFWYLNYNDAKYEYPRVEAIQVDIPDNTYPFIATMDREIDTTMSINAIASQAFKEQDWATFAWLMGDDDEHGKLIREQIEEESISRHIARIATEMDTDWLTIQDTIIEFYNSPKLNKSEE